MIRYVTDLRCKKKVLERDGREIAYEDVSMNVRCLVRLSHAFAVLSYTEN